MFDVLSTPAVAGLIATAVAIALFWLSLNIPERHAWLPRAGMVAAGLAAVACAAVAVIG